MRDEKRLGGYEIKGLRKSLLTPSPPWTRRTFRHLVPSDLPPPKQGSCSAVGWKIAPAKALAECRNERGGPTDVLGAMRGSEVMIENSDMNQRSA
jgi:hypothetical protein